MPQSSKALLFGTKIAVGLATGVIVGSEKKRKWTYYNVVFEHPIFTSNDFLDCLVEYEIVREDKLDAITNQ